jgi:RimJ/RimL family protein N-acetyltransferase
MIKLNKLEQTDFDIFKSWIKDKNELLQFAGSLLTFPITDDQLLKYITDERRIVYKVLLTETNELIGNAELNFENPLPRLSRILIGNIKNRNKGFGKQIVTKFLEKLFLEYDFQAADLNVFEWNKAGIKCYENVGFKINPDLVYKYNNDGEIWTALNMTIE